ncbi:MAG: hypothetical protein AAF551_15505 [Bacteroidota bacterium]
MRFPSLFRLPRHQQFHIKPRYYDPVKEEIKERTERIKQSIEGGKSSDYLPAQISFKRKSKPAPATSMIQLMIAAILGVIVLGWFEFGNDIFYYLLWLLVPGYLIYRLKQVRRQK